MTRNSEESKRTNRQHQLRSTFYSTDELRPKLFSHLLLGFIVVIFVGLGSWAAWARLDEVTRGTGRVIPSRQTQIVQNLEGGIVAELMVREGQVVEESEVLMRIDNVRAASDYRETKARYLSLTAAIARLTAEINETAINFPQEVLSEARDLAESETAFMGSRQAELEAQLDILRSQVIQREQELAELKTKLNQYDRSYRLASEELQLIAPHAKTGVVSKSDFLQKQREVNDLKGQFEQTRLAVPRVESALREANQRIESAYSTFRSEAQRDLSIRRAELAGIREIIVAGEDRVRRTEVRSPVRGTIKSVHFNTIGGVIQPGDHLFEIVPLEDTLLVEAQVRPADVAFLRPGLPATVKITAYDFSIYGGLAGTVENISADTIVDERGESFYRMRVRTAESSLGTAEKPLEIIPGMTAEVDVITGEKTVLDYILKPILKARDHALRER
ncbi:MAG: HlyD family type I secretion periplasmic adaptor subunit [Geminicoccaceae bacterium]|nr:HlyD family type I secretion periplasmic adaptor subunit [Geminicoccaceae bacterium]